MEGEPQQSTSAENPAGSHEHNPRTGFFQLISCYKSQQLKDLGRFYSLLLFLCVCVCFSAATGTLAF